MWLLTLLSIAVIAEKCPGQYHFVMNNDATTPLTKRGHKRRQALLDAATDIFLEQGYAGTTLDMIIAHAGGSRRSLYDYFGDKEGLFAAVITYHANKLVEDIRRIDVEGLPAREGLTLLASAFVESLIAPVHLALYRLLITESPSHPALGKTIYQVGPGLLLEQLDQYLDYLCQRGELPAERRTPHTARQFLGMIKTDFQICALLCPEQLPSPPQIQAHIDACVSLLLDNH